MQAERENISARACLKMPYVDCKMEDSLRLSQTYSSPSVFVIPTTVNGVCVCARNEDGCRPWIYVKPLARKKLKITASVSLLRIPG